MLSEALRRVIYGRRTDKFARFRLEYQPKHGDRVTVGHLTFDKGRWSFEYDPEYRDRSSHLRPIEGFDDLWKTYRSRVLFPFFAVRIPDKGRRDVRLRLKQHRIEDPDTTDLLRVFGRRAAASPAFELVEA